MRDIMSRMIGAEIRYTRMGYYMRQAPFGYVSSKIETQNGKRSILKPDPESAKYIKKIFEMRCQGYDDNDILETVNAMGYTSRENYIRNKNDRTKILQKIGGKQLELKGLIRHLSNPLYAGVNCEKWTDDKPIKCKFKGLVSIETFNKANRGKIAISESNGQVAIYRKATEQRYALKGVKNIEYPYKRVVMCPTCEKPLYASASTGKSGKKFPAYHCSRNDHHFYVSKNEFEETIRKFVQNISIKPDVIEAFTEAVLTEWAKKEAELNKSENSLDARIQGLETEASSSVDKIKILSSETAIKYMEGELVKIEQEIITLKNQREIAMKKKPLDFKIIVAYVKYFLEHLEYLLLEQIDPLKKANFFSILFDKTPTYQNLLLGTPKLNKSTGVNELFLALSCNKVRVVTSAGFEPAIFRMRT